MIWHNSTADEVLSELSTDKEKGLDSSEALKRVHLYGKNEYHDERKKNVFIYIINEFKGLAPCLLAVIAVIYLILALFLHIGGWLDSVTVLLVLFCSAIVSGAVKFLSDHHNEGLKNSLPSYVTVIRDGKEVQIKENLLVPGDIMVLKSGDYVRADGRLISAYVLKCDEFLVSGETVPVDKIPEELHEDITPLPKRSNMVYRGSIVVNGRGIVVVTDTADATELGMRGKLEDSIEKTQSVMSQKLDAVKKVSNRTSLVLSIIAFALGVLVNFFSDANFAGIVTQYLFLALSLYVASATYAIPLMLKLAMTFSSLRLKAGKITVTNPEILEDLKDVSVICADKTGILTTENLKIEKIFGGIKSVDLTEEGLDDSAAGVLRLAMICSNFAHDEHTEKHSNNMERAIETACIERLGVSKNDIDGMFPKLAELPFDSERMLMTTVTAINGNPVAIVKGAPEVVIERCSNFVNDAVLNTANEYAKSGLKVIAVAIKQLSEIPANPNSDELENDLSFTGIIGFSDQIDPAASSLCRECINAGIRIVMVTGDHLDTAIAAAKSVGILTNDEQAISGDTINSMSDEELCNVINDFTVFARLSPEQKLRIVQALKTQNEKVFVTGDSVNDTSSMLEADIGCALGKTAADIVQDSADLVIKDNKFKTIVNAIKESGRIFTNIKKCISYYLTYNITIFSTVLICMLFSGRSPLSPAGIMLLSVVSLALPIIAFLAEFSKTSLKIVPKNSSVINLAFLIRFISPIVIITLLSAIAFAVTKSYENTSANAVIFAIIGMSFIAHTFSTSIHSFFISKSTLTSLVAPVLCVASFILYLVLLVTPIGNMISVNGLNGLTWFFAILSAIIVFALDEGLKLLSFYVIKEKF